MFLAFASYKGFTVYQLDVKSAFLYGKVRELVYVEQPPGFSDPDHPDRVYKLDKALYGLHQPPRAWNETMSTHLLKNGIFIHQTKYVHDILTRFKMEDCSAYYTPIPVNHKFGPDTKNDNNIDPT